MRNLKLVLAALFLFLGVGAVPAQIVITTPLQGPTLTPLTPSTTFTTGAATATLAGAAGKWNYICGFTVTSTATTSSIPGTITVTGTPSTMNFTYTFVQTGQGILGIAFPGCITASAPNTNIVVNVPAGGTGTVGSVSAWGFVN